MGLAGPRTKQRLGPDPQNKAWRDDKNKFGLLMLQKMGWKEGTGLGIKSTGITQSVKFKVKDDVLGLGCEKKAVHDWTEQADAFDALLRGMGADSTRENGSSNTLAKKSATDATSAPKADHSATMNMVASFVKSVDSEECIKEKITLVKEVEISSLPKVISSKRKRESESESQEIIKKKKKKKKSRKEDKKAEKKLSKKKKKKNKAENGDKGDSN